LKHLEKSVWSLFSAIEYASRFKTGRLPNQAKALNVAMIVGLIILILAFLGITVVSRSQVEGFLRVILPVLEWIKTLIES